METLSTSGQAPDQLHLPLGVDGGPGAVGIEVQLPFAPDESAAYGTPRLKGSFSSRVDEVVAPVRASSGLSIHGEKFFAKVVVRGQSYEVSGAVVARDVRPFGEPDAEAQMVVERVDAHAAKRYVNGAYYRCDLTAEVSRAAERAVRAGYAQAVQIPDDSVTYAAAA